MTRRPEKAPRLGAAILNRLADRNDALAGDILEGFAARGSRFWFWRELVGAVLTGGFRRSSEVRPLKLVEFPSWRAPLENFEARRQRLQTLGLGASPVEGIGGISIVAVIFLITLIAPLLWLMLAVGVLCGVAVGVVRVRLQRRHPIDPLSHVLVLR